MGARAPTQLTGQVSDTTNQTANYVGNSCTPEANEVYVIFVHLSVGSGTPDTPTLSGCGLTFAQQNNGTFNGGVNRLTAFTASGASPTTGSITVNVSGGTTHTGCLMRICKVPLTDLASPVVDKNTNSGSSTAASCTITTFTGTITVAGIATDTTAVTPGSNYTELLEDTISGPSSHLEAEYWENPSTGVADSSNSLSRWRISALNMRDRAATALPVFMHHYRQQRMV